VPKHRCPASFFRDIRLYDTVGEVIVFTLRSIGVEVGALGETPATRIRGSRMGTLDSCLCQLRSTCDGPWWPWKLALRGQPFGRAAAFAGPAFAVAPAISALLVNQWLRTPRPEALLQPLPGRHLGKRCGKNWIHGLLYGALVSFSLDRLGLPSGPSAGSVCRWGLDFPLG